jgi:hypothetical protein
MILLLCLILALIWGGIWGVVLQHTRWGRFIAARHAWLAVVIGLGVDLLILLVILPVTVWLPVCAVVATSAIGIIGRSLANEWREHMELLEGVDASPYQARE